MPVDIVKELRRLSRTPKITFEKGILRTDHEDQLGYVSDLKNMEIINGSAQRRKGTRVINAQDQAHSWHFIEEVEISGSVILLGLDKKGDFYCMLDDWPNNTMPVWDKSIFKKWTKNNNSGKRHIGFRRGDKFWNFQDNQYFYCINNYGDAVKINKYGFFRINQVDTSLSAITSASWRWPYYNLTALLTHPAPTISCATNTVFVDAEDCSNRLPPSFQLIPDGRLNDNATPIRGTVRLAFKNDSGVISKWSEPTFLYDYKKVFVSLFPAVPYKFEGSFSFNERFNFDFKSAGYSASGDPTVLRSGTLETPKYFIKTAFSDTRSAASNSSGFNTFPVKLWYVHHGFQVFDTVAFTGTAVGTGVWTDLSDATTFMVETGSWWLWFTCAHYAAAIVTAAMNNFFHLKNVRGFEDIDHTNANNSPYEGRGDFDTHFIPAYTAVSYPIYIVSAAAPLYYTEMQTEDLSATSVGTAVTYERTYQGSTHASSIVTTQWKRIRAPEFTPSLGASQQLCVIRDLGNAKYRFYGCMYLADMDYNVSGNNTLVKLANYGFSYSTASMASGNYQAWGKQYGDLEAWKCYTATTYFNFTDEFTACNDLNPYNHLIEFKWTAIHSANWPTKRCDTYLLMHIDTSYATIWHQLYGQRFVVWNDGKIIGESQRAVSFDFTTGGGTLSYDYISTAIIASGQYNQMVYGQSYKIYVPILSCDYMNLKSYNYTIQESLEIIKEPEQIVFNGNKLYVIQNASLWFGSTDLMIYGGRQLDFTVEFMLPFHDGVVIFGSKGIYWVDKNDTLYSDKRVYVKACCDGDTGVFYIDINDRVYYMNLNFEYKQVPRPTHTELSTNITEMDFGSNPKMHYFDDTLWVSTGLELWGYKDNGWTKKYSFNDREISLISHYKNELVLSFDINPDYDSIMNINDDTFTLYM